ncbi:PHP domain-containing protein [Kangiella sediminilitoris]|uniref:PHP domain protein n=1 Tax=Kangiella sediminilitoris TaxID=1144748 RepID=A0A1B3BBP7_9GAMM|nr:PHP domain-containing protein [Kangiella sediminilitoris]AOE50216.1 PHP domain protein [Kangiella sediminilitoris]
MMLRDLHCHTVASDGDLTVSELLKLASERGVDELAITDHDSIDCLAESMSLAEGFDINLVPGVEISATAGRKKDTLHIVGLQVDYQHAGLTSFLRDIQNKRHQRALEMAHKLEKSGIRGALPDIEYMLDSQPMVCRTHLAQYLLDRGEVKTFGNAFKQYLAQGGKAYVKDQWFDIEDVVAMIIQAGGIPVLAHPTRYGMGSNKLKQIVEHFKSIGGKGIEVCYPNLHPGQKNLLADWCRKFELYASQGSDFHSPDKPWALFGKFAPLPESVTPVWQSPDWS